LPTANQLARKIIEDDMLNGRLFFKDYELGTVGRIQLYDFPWMEGDFSPGEAFLNAQFADDETDNFPAKIAGFLRWMVATLDDEQPEIPPQFEVFFEPESNAWQIIMEDGEQRRISIPVIANDNRITWRI
jgi:hypothetical protein